MKWRLLNTGPGNHYFNMALDEAIFLSCKKSSVPSTIRFYNWDVPAITFGYFQKLNALEDILKGFDFPFVRRMTGGGAVLHCSDLTFSIICRYNEVLNCKIRESYQKISRAISRGLQKIGLETYVDRGGTAKSQFCFSAVQPGDVAIENKKLAGGAQRRNSGILLHQGSILIEKNRKFVKFYDGAISLTEATGRKIVVGDEIIRFLVKGFEEEFNIILKEGRLEKNEIILAKKLVEKYKSSEWNNRY